MADAYTGLLDWQRAMTPQARMPLYNGRAYTPDGNPWGLSEGGNSLLFEAFIADWVAVGLSVQQLVAAATSAARQSGSWEELENVTVSKLADNQVAVSGNYVPLFSARRAVRPMLTGTESGWIATAIYDQPSNRTVLTVSGFVVPAGISTIFYGQDPANAPKPPDVPVNVAQSLYFANNFMTP